MKQFRDPVYGYIDVDDDYIPIINSAEFQRLRNIRQTGYESLYPSALHNRFVHSLGVFYLGKIAAGCLHNNSSDVLKAASVDDTCWDQIAKTFILSCLLHDVGHAPFSHTGESFYNASTMFEDELHDLIKNPDAFMKDLKACTFEKPHEAMSAIIGIKLLDKLGYKYDKEFFARSIMGIEYSSRDDASIQIKSCLVTILNGSLVDVDKLDYLMRDAYVTGYSTMSIDYKRLLAGYTVSIIKSNVKGNIYRPAFKKGSLSIIENITYANDLERRWIQTNPTVLYDCKLIELAIIRYNDYMMEKYSKLKSYGNVFNQKAISNNGFSEDGIKLRLLCDDDIITFLKNDDNSIVAEHYFSRDLRFKPLWKSESEYGLKVKPSIAQDLLENFLSFLRDAKDSIFFINSEELHRLQKERDNAENPGNKKKLDQAFYLTKFLCDFAASESLKFEFAVVMEKAFISSRKKMQEYPIYVVFDETRVETFMDIMYGKERSVDVRSDKLSDTHVFYVYTSNENIENILGKNQNMAELLLKYINANWKPEIDMLQ